jgi:Protein kinase domain
VVLQRLNTREVVLPPALAITFVLELLEVLAAAHASGVVHGALTPGNVLVGADGRPSVADFGALRALQASDRLKDFAARGRTSYRAPELKTKLSEATIATDLYAVGAMLYELLTLREASLGNVALGTRAERLPPPSRLVRRLNARIDPIVMRALEQLPGRRQKSAEDFAQTLGEFLSAQGGVPRKEELTTFVTQLFPNEVQATVLGPVPFEHDFTLAPLQPLEGRAAAPAVVGARSSFSGGEVNEATPTSDGLPVFRGSDEPTLLGAALEAPPDPKTQRFPALPGPTPSWDAPPGPMPVEPVAESAKPEKVRRRLRSLEDFGGPPQAAAAPRRSLPAMVKKTVLTFARNFRRSNEVSRPDMEVFRQRAVLRARWASVIGTFALMGTLAAMVGWWWHATPDPVAALISYLPDPIERALPKHRAPPVPVVTGPPIELPDFDDPKRKVEPPKPPVVVKPAPAVDADCYAAPKGGGAIAVLVEGRVAVDVDGRRVCGNIGKIGASAGSHAVRVVEQGSKREYMTTAEVGPGRVTRVVPNFKAR